jgi:serine/threonine-protein kinase
MPSADAGDFPDDELLRRFLDGELDEDRAADLARRLDRDPSLASRLDALQDSAPLTAAVRSALARADGDDSAPTIPGYEDLRVLQRGGQGVVYVGRQTSTDREVAVKLLPKSALVTRKQEFRFEREIELASRMDHPNVVTVFDRGVTEDGRRYVVMERIHGLALDRHADAEDLGLAARMAVFDRTCAAVSYAHRRGIIHRDLKPENVLVDGSGEPRVLDFGLAKIPGDDDPTSSLVTREGEFVGTLAYAAPEQVSGSGTELDVRTDVYALGVMLYRLLTGSHPYPTDGAIGDLVTHVTRTDPTRPSRLGARSDSDLDALCLTCLAKEPGARYASVDALREDIERWRAGRPLMARSDRRGYVLRRTLHRYRWPATGLAVVLLSLAASTVVSLNALGEARSEATRAGNLSDFLVDTLLAALPGVHPAEVTVGDLVAQASEDVGSRFPDEPESEAAVRDAIGQVLRAAGRTELAEEHLAAALALRERHVGPGHLLTLESRLHLAHLLSAVGRLAEAEALLDRVDGSLRAAGNEPSDLLRLEHSRLLGALRVAQGRPEEAVALVRDAAAVAQEAGELAMAPKLLSLLADALRSAGDPARALAVQEDAEAALVAQLGEDHVFVEISRHDQALMLDQLGRHDEALARIEPIVDRLARELGDEHPSTLTTRVNLASMLHKRGQDAEARGQLVELVTLSRTRFGDRHRITLMALHALGALLRGADEITDALPLLTLAHAGRREVLGPGHELTLRTQNELALATGRGGDLPGAEALLRDTVARGHAELGPLRFETLEGEYSLAVMLLDTGRTAEAEALLADLLPRAEIFYGLDQYQPWLYHFQHALAAARIGRLDEAAEELPAAHAGLAASLGPTAPMTRASASLAAQVLDALGDGAAAERWRQAAQAEESDKDE